MCKLNKTCNGWKLILLKGGDNPDEQDPLPNDEDAYMHDNETTIATNEISTQSANQATTIDVPYGINEKFSNG